MQKIRLDVLLAQQGLAESRALAQRLVMAGQVRVDGQVALKPAVKVAQDARLEIDRGPRFVSRGGEKLEGAFCAFDLAVEGKICADVGASTGGFTDCLLQHGAEKVYAIDVGYGILHWKMRTHPRVIPMERTNARYLENLPEPVSFVTVDASFISLKLLLPVFQKWLGPQGGQAVALIKPQFEAGREVVSRGEGVVLDPEIHRQVLREVLQDAQGVGYGVKGLARSPLRGPKGNVEFLAWLVYPGQERADLEELIAPALEEKAG